jgi:hypothetical protein
MQLMAATIASVETTRRALQNAGERIMRAAFWLGMEISN